MLAQPPGPGGLPPPPMPGFPGELIRNLLSIQSLTKFAGLPGMPPPPFMANGPGAPPGGIIPRMFALKLLNETSDLLTNTPHVAPGGRGMPPFPPFPPAPNGAAPSLGPGGIPPPNMPGGLPFPPPAGFPPPNFQIPGNPSPFNGPGGPSPSPGPNALPPPGFGPPPGMKHDGR